MTQGAGSWLRLLMGLLLAVLSFSTAALNCATPGKDGAGGTLTGTINRYWPGSASASATSISISLGTSIGAGSSIVVGDLLLVIQMQDAAINSTNTSSYGDNASGSGSITPNNTGLYEYVRATSTGTDGGSVTIVGGGGGGLLNTYTNAAANGTQGQRRFQVVRVPQYTTATLSSGLTAAAWDGRAGGVLVFDVAGQLTLGGTVSVDGKGFRGGGARQKNGSAGLSNADYVSLTTLNANGGKGEGIAGTPRYVNSFETELDTGVEGYPNGSYARGAPGNAGGGGTDGRPSANDQNTGGGGGSNAGTGGKGGNAWSSSATTGGLGGAAYSGSLAPGRLFLGGGGGAGTTNNGTGSLLFGFASSGAAGGGLVMIRAGSIIGSGAITANGVSANSTVLNDGSGGGGAGGSVLVYSSAGSVGALSIQVNGGNGGSNTGLNSPHGPGGGGSGGYVVTSGAASVSYAGGAAGTTGSGTAWYAGNFGATDGTGGTSATLGTGQIPGVKSGFECAIVVVKSFSPDTTTVAGGSTLSITLTSSNSVAITGIVLSDVFPITPGAMKVASPLATTNSCGGTLRDTNGNTLAAAEVGIRLNLGVLLANGSCTFSVKVTAPAVGTYTNTIAAGALTSANGGTNAAAASATLVVGLPSLIFMKTVAVTSDPVNHSANPKNIPGAEVLYSLRLANTGTGPVDSSSTVITDPIPANTELFVGNLGGVVPGPIDFLQQGSSTTPPSWTYSSLASTTDDVDFSNVNCVDFSYVPVPSSDNYDPAVKCIRLNPKGTLGGARGTVNPFFELRFRVRIK